MNFTLKTLMIAVALTLAGAPAWVRADDAVTAKPGEIKTREVNQQRRIAQGVQSGELTPGETARLETREAELRKQLAADRSANGGKLTPAERVQINQELNTLSKRIFQLKHNQRTVSPAAGK